MALADELARIHLEAETLMQTFSIHYNLMRRLRANPRNISDADFLQALSNLHNVVADLISVVARMSHALGEIERQSMDSWIRRTAQGR